MRLNKLRQDTYSNEVKKKKKPEHTGCSNWGTVILSESALSRGALGHGQFKTCGKNNDLGTPFYVRSVMCPTSSHTIQ